MKAPCCIGFWSLILALDPLAAQEREGAFSSMFDKVGHFVLTTFQRPIRPVVETTAPGSGIAIGVGVEALRRGAWLLEGKATASVHSFTSGQALAGYLSQRFSVSAYGQSSDAPRLEYFGQGMQSDERDRSDYRQIDHTIGVASSYRVTSWLGIGARVELLRPAIRRGRANTVPDLHDVFVMPEPPGLTQQPRFRRYAMDVFVDVPASAAEDVNQGGQLYAGFAAYRDRDLDAYSFQRMDIGLHYDFAVAGSLRRLLIDARATRMLASGGNTVPFYFQPTLGRYRAPTLAPYRNIEVLEPRAALRGYANQRFRDQHSVVVQTEYRHTLWGPVAAALFAEAGQVAPRMRAFTLARTERDIGIGFVLMRGIAPAMRADVAVGSEGVRFLVQAGRALLP